MSSDHALCVISPEYFREGRMVDFEMLMARRRDPGGRHSRLIPLILRQTDLPESICGLIPVDWINNRNLKREWRKLLMTLHAPNREAEPPRPCEYVSSDPHEHKHELSVALEVLEKAKAKLGVLPTKVRKTPRDLPQAGYTQRDTSFRCSQNQTAFRPLSLGAG
jgi:hypothetical protein